MEHVNGRDYLLVRPLTISGCHIKNRLGLGPINNGLFEDNGDVSPKGLSFFEQYFANDIGLVFVGGVAVSREGRSNRRALLLDSELKTIGLQKLTTLAHRYGSKIAIQLMHAGRQTNPDEIEALTVAPSAIPCPIVGKMPEGLDRAGIRRIVSCFGDAAVYAQRSGVDMIEVHGSHGYLISEFLSPYANKRADEYGGSVENRFRLLSEILSEIRSRTSIPVGVRINCYENVPNGLTIDEVIEGVSSVITTPIAYLAVSAGFYAKPDIIMPSRKLGKALWREEAIRIREALGLPVMLTGNIDSIELADALLREGFADVILMVRSLLADPELFTKSLKPGGGRIQPCTDCGMCKYHSRGLPSVYCPFNPVLTDLDRYKVKLRTESI